MPWPLPVAGGIFFCSILRCGLNSEVTVHMNRRKGETIARTNLIELAVPPRMFQGQDLEFDTFHREHRIPIHCGSAHQEEGQFYVRFCFPRADLAHAFRERFGGEYMTYPPKRFRMRRITASRQKYEPRVFGGRVVMPDELERMHRGLLEFERIECVSDEMRKLIEEVWPELAHKLPPEETH
jgi:hypothetical protein